MEYILSRLFFPIFLMVIAVGAFLFARVSLTFASSTCRLRVKSLHKESDTQRKKREPINCWRDAITARQAHHQLVMRFRLFTDCRRIQTGASMRNQSEKRWIDSKTRNYNDAVR